MPFLASLCCRASGNHAVVAVIDHGQDADRVKCLGEELPACGRLKSVVVAQGRHCSAVLLNSARTLPGRRCHVAHDSAPSPCLRASF
jgi:hypothetical protein